MATTIVLKFNKKVQTIPTPSSFEELVSVIKQKFYIKDSKPKIVFKDEDDDKYDIKDEESYQDFLSTNDELTKIKGTVSAKKFFEPPKEDSSDDDSEEEKPKPKQNPKKKEKDKDKDQEKEKEKEKDQENENVQAQINEKNDKEDKLIQRIADLEQCNLELKKTVDRLTSSLNTYIVQIEKHNNGIDSIIQSHAQLINSMFDNKEMFQNINQNLNKVTKIVTQKSELLSNSIDNSSSHSFKVNQVSTTSPYNTVQNVQSTSKMLNNQQYYDNNQKKFVNNNEHLNPTLKPEPIINQPNPVLQNSLGLSQLPPSASQLIGNPNSSTSVPKGEYNCQYVTTEIKISREQYDKKEFFLNIIITNNGTLPWPAKTVFKMARANQKDIAIEDIIVSENIVNIGDKIHIQPKATIISSNAMNNIGFQGFLYNKEIGVIGKVTTFNIVVVEVITTIEIKDKQPEKKEGPKELSQETIEEMYNELCKEFKADECFAREDIINAIKQSQGDLEKARENLFG